MQPFGTEDQDARDIPEDVDLIHIPTGRTVRRSKHRASINDRNSVAVYDVTEEDDWAGGNFMEYVYCSEVAIKYPVEEQTVERQTQSAQPEVYRPVLEERKTGKVQVHLVDQGFPNALMEVAKVMTWAGEVKGYKPHDWKNLPDAENALEGAASRHRMVHNQQRQAGAELKDCTDHESLILHKAHEAFNVLAELELILTGKIA